eukprot:scaffold117941_cov60-Attheya_sp.AAC.7
MTLSRPRMLAVTVLGLLLASLSCGTTSASIPLVSSVAKAVQKRTGKKQYTPLLFFTAPKGVSSDVDLTEKKISQLEEELGVTVERLDVMRDRASSALNDLVNPFPDGKLPFLYHRESRQKLVGIESCMDEHRLRAWAKGRWLPPSSTLESKKKGGGSAVLEEEGEGSISQEELLQLEQQSMTPVQRKGRDAMIKRMKDDAELIRRSEGQGP